MDDDRPSQGDDGPRASAVERATGDAHPAAIAFARALARHDAKAMIDQARRGGEDDAGDAPA